MIYEVNHNTSYDYETPVIRSQHLIHLEPRDLPNQRLLRHSLLIEPAPTSRADRTDYFGNKASVLRIEVDHDELVVHARSTVAVSPPPLIDLDQSPPWERLADMLGTPAAHHFAGIVQFTCASRQTRLGAELGNYARESFKPGVPVLRGARDLTRRIYEDFTFDSTATDVSTPVSEVMRTRRGVCQDFSHVMLAAVRTLGLPGCYVSGYLLTKPPPGQPRLQGADASHAWVAIWSPEAGWVAFDPTNDMIVSDEHITVAYGREYDDVNPIAGVLLGGNEHTVSVSVDVRPE